MSINYNRPFHYAPPEEDIAVLHSDRDVLIVSKPSGLLSVPGKPPDHADCLESRIKEKFPTATIVHRLDMSTSGVMVMALNIESHRHLSLQFEKRKTRKTYIARVSGTVQKDNGDIDLPIACDWPNRPMQMADPVHGRPAQTRWEVLKRENNTFTRLRLFPLTGRSHQLRVHMLELGHPILGDEFYAPDDAYNAAPRLMLHAESLSFLHPVTKTEQTFTDPAPF